MPPLSPATPLTLTDQQQRIVAHEHGPALVFLVAAIPVGVGES